MDCNKKCMDAPQSIPTFHFFTLSCGGSLLSGAYSHSMVAGGLEEMS